MQRFIDDNNGTDESVSGRKSTEGKTDTDSGRQHRGWIGVFETDVDWL